MRIDDNIDRGADRFRGALVGLAIGDSLGAHLEANPHVELERLAEWVDDALALPRSVDTTMAIATTRSLIEARGFDEAHMTEMLSTEVRSSHGEDTARQLFEVEEHDDDEIEEPVASSSSFGNGAALRAAPVGLLYHRSPVLAADVAAQAAWITHAHPLGVDGAALQAAAVAELMIRTTFDPPDLLERLRSRVRTRWFREYLKRWDDISGSAATTARLFGNGVEAHRSVPAALYCFLQNHESFRKSVLFALSLGGEASALGSMTGALAGARLGASRIPATWIDRLASRQELVELADALLDVAVVND